MEVDKQTEAIKNLEETVRQMRLKTLLPPHLYLFDTNEEFEGLKLLLDNKVWPKAIDQKMICEMNENDKKDRAEKIVDFLIDTPLEFLKFLDYGCGEGHVVHKAYQQKPKLAIGYDVKKSDVWAKNQGTFTDSLSEVKENGPYDVILLYDVIDHLRVKDKNSVDEKDIMDTLTQIKKMLTAHGRVYIRTHPWSSRHATHLYHKINKAYIHLVFTADELESIGLVGDPISFKVIHPLHQYQHWFQRVGFNMLRRDVVEEATEPFFADTPIVSKRIKANWISSNDRNLSGGRNFPFLQTSVQFIDYVITAA